MENIGANDRRASLFLSVVAAATVFLGFEARARAFDLPKPTIDAIQATVDNAVRLAVNGRVSGSVGLLDRIDWRVDFDAGLAFTEWPTITCSGQRCEARFVALSRGFDFEIYLPFEITMGARANIDFPVLPDASGSANLDKIIGTLVVLPITHSNLLRFEADTANATCSFSDEGGNVSVDGLTGDFVKIGTLSGGLVFGVAGFGVGALVGLVGGNEAEDAIRDAIKKQFAKALETAGKTATTALRDELAKHDEEVIGTLAALVGLTSAI